MHPHATRTLRHATSGHLRHPAPHRPRLSTQLERDEASEAVEHLVNAGVSFAAAAAAVRMGFAGPSSPRHR